MLLDTDNGTALNSPQRNEEANEFDGNASCYNNDDLRVVAAHHRSVGIILE